MLPKRSRATRILDGIDRLLGATDRDAHAVSEREIQSAYDRYTRAIAAHVLPRPTGQPYDWAQDQRTAMEVTPDSNEAPTMFGPMDRASALSPSALLAVWAAVDHAAAVAVEALIDDYRRSGRGRVNEDGCRRAIAAKLWSAVQDGVTDCREFMGAL